MAEEAVVVRATLIKKVITTQSLNGDGYVDPSVRGLEVDCFPVPCYSNDGAAMCAVVRNPVQGSCAQQHFDAQEIITRSVRFAASATTVECPQPRDDDFTHHYRPDDHILRQSRVIK